MNAAGSVRAPRGRPKVRGSGHRVFDDRDDVEVAKRALDLEPASF